VKQEEEALEFSAKGKVVAHDLRNEVHADRKLLSGRPFQDLRFLGLEYSRARSGQHPPSAIWRFTQRTTPLPSTSQLPKRRPRSDPTKCRHPLHRPLSLLRLQRWIYHRAPLSRRASLTKAGLREVQGKLHERKRDRCGRQGVGRGGRRLGMR